MFDISDRAMVAFIVRGSNFLLSKILFFSLFIAFFLFAAVFVDMRFRCRWRKIWKSLFLFLFYSSSSFLFVLVTLRDLLFLSKDCTLGYCRSTFRRGLGSWGRFVRELDLWPLGLDALSNRSFIQLTRRDVLLLNDTRGSIRWRHFELLWKLVYFLL